MPTLAASNQSVPAAFTNLNRWPERENPLAAIGPAAIFIVKLMFGLSRPRPTAQRVN